MEMNIEWIPSYKIAYFRHNGPYGLSNKQTMEHLKNWAASHDLLDDESVILGIAQDDPAVTQPESCRYDACLIVPDSFRVNDDSICLFTMAGGKYAVFKVSHTTEAVQKAWLEIFPALKNRGYQADDTKPIIEKYAAKILKDHRCEICVPVY